MRANNTATSHFGGFKLTPLQVQSGVCASSNAIVKWRSARRQPIARRGTAQTTKHGSRDRLVAAS